jgi:hypothetical protein
LVDVAKFIRVNVDSADVAAPRVHSSTRTQTHTQTHTHTHTNTYEVSQTRSCMRDECDRDRRDAPSK